MNFDWKSGRISLIELLAPNSNSMLTPFQLTTMTQKQEYSKISRGNMNIMFICPSTFPAMVVGELLF